MGGLDSSATLAQRCKVGRHRPRRNTVPPTVPVGTVPPLAVVPYKFPSVPKVGAPGPKPSGPLKLYRVVMAPAGVRLNKVPHGTPQYSVAVPAPVADP